MDAIPVVLNFICNLEPLWIDLKDLQRSHILKYMNGSTKVQKRVQNVIQTLSLILNIIYLL